MFSLPQKIGFNAERKACRYLKRQGLIVKAKNFRGPQGEIDLIMADSDMLVFVEVRYRRRDDFGHPIETVTYAKQQRLIKTAYRYLTQHHLHDKLPWRFDIVGMTKKQPIIWIKNAFTVQC